MKLENVVPEKLVKIRPLGHDDVARLARWIECGRQEGWFRSGERLDATSVMRYQQSVRQSRWEYCCLVIEDDGHPMGYLDYRYRNRSAEILGIFLEPRYRGHRIGRHLLRWAVAALREHGCGEVSVEVYAHNTASLSACRAAGFHHDPAQNRIEDGQQVYVLRRRIEPFLRLSPPEPRYALLRGEDIHLHHIAVAEALTDAVKDRPGIEVILGLGSLSRGFADEWSDIDLAVLGRGPSLRHLGRGEHHLAGDSIDLDLFVVDLDAATPSRWDESRRQAFGESVVLFARNASVLRSIRYGVRLGKKERSRRIQDLLFRIGWIGFQPRQWFNRRQYGYVWSVPHDLWVRRGCIASAHATIDQAFNYILQLLFLVNGRRVPDPKWRRYLAPGLTWLPAEFSSLVDKIDQSGRDQVGVRLRAEAVFTLIEGVVQRLEETGEIGGDLYKSYLLHASDYNPKA